MPQSWPRDARRICRPARGCGHESVWRDERSPRNLNLMLDKLQPVRFTRRLRDELIIRRVKRLALSLLGGIVIPFSYAVILTVVFFRTRRVAFFRLSIPVSWPSFVLFRLLPYHSFPLRPEDRIFLAVFVIVCDVFLYSSLIYFLLWRRSLRKRKAQRFDLPPNPPQFVQ